MHNPNANAGVMMSFTEGGEKSLQSRVRVRHEYCHSRDCRLGNESRESRDYLVQGL